MGNSVVVVVVVVVVVLNSEISTDRDIEVIFTVRFSMFCRVCSSSVYPA